MAKHHLISTFLQNDNKVDKENFDILSIDIDGLIIKYLKANRFKVIINAINYSK